MMGRRRSLADEGTEELVAFFTTMAVDQNNALRRYETGKYNRLYHQMAKVTAELKSRDGDQRRALMPLYQHPNPTVRFKSAMATLALAPLEARRVLQTIKDRKEFPIAMYASQMLNALDEGRYTPA